MHEQGKIQKTDLRRSCLHLRLILSTDSAYTNNNNDQKKKKKKRKKETKYKLQQTLRKMWCAESQENDEWGNSLPVQWLGFCTFTAKARFQSLVEELRYHKPCRASKKPSQTKTLNLIKKWV